MITNPPKRLTDYKSAGTPNGCKSAGTPNDYKSAGTHNGIKY